MKTALRRQPLDRRRLPERRTRPTTFFRALHWRGRRQGFRRVGEGRHAYVDSLAWRIVVLALLVFVGSLLDALLTLRHLQHGGQEANPWLALALTHHPTVSPAEDRHDRGRRMVAGGPPIVSTGAARAARADPQLWGRAGLSPRPLLAPRVEARRGLCCEVRVQREQPVEEGEGGTGSMSHRQLSCHRSHGKRGLAIELARATIASPHDHEEQSS